MTLDSCPPCHAIGDLPGSSTCSSAPGIAPSVGLPDAQRVAGVGLVAIGDHHRRRLDRGEVVDGRERPRARHRSSASATRLGMLVLAPGAGA